ncbi:MAG TPA: D-aminoacyl-tRNA deacylase [bacterium]|nr:D-aminoacyl-tRNA deacylase [bacterium]
MRALLQRVRRADVRVGGRPSVAAADDPGELVGQIGPGLVVLLGVGLEDTAEVARHLAGRVAHLRIFGDEAGRLNRSALDVGGEILSISQFTLYADTSGGRRPSFVRAAPPDAAEPLYLEFNRALEASGLRVVPGRFRTHMIVAIHNDGPVTVLLDSGDR